MQLPCHSNVPASSAGGSEVPRSMRTAVLAEPPPAPPGQGPRSLSGAPSPAGQPGDDAVLTHVGQGQRRGQAAGPRRIDGTRAALRFCGAALAQGAPGSDLREPPRSPRRARANRSIANTWEKAQTHLPVGHEPAKARHRALGARAAGAPERSPPEAPALAGGVGALRCKKCGFVLIRE